MLRLPRFRLIEPRSWSEAADALRENGAVASDVGRGTPTLRVMLVAGGTDLFPNMKRRQFTPEVLVSLGRVRDARAIHANGGLALGAGTTLTQIALGASVHVENASGRRSLALAELYREDGIRYLAIGRDDVVVSITLPEAGGWRSTYLKLRDRGAFDFPIAGVAAAVRYDGATVAEARVAITALGP